MIERQSGKEPVTSTAGEVLWAPSPERVRASSLQAFVDFLQTSRGRSFATYDELHRWSVEDIGAFWQAVGEFCGWIHAGQTSPALGDPAMPGARWFENVRLNFAENLLHARVGRDGKEIEGDRTAIIFEGELDDLRREMTYAELRDRVRRCAAGLRRLGLRSGERVAALTPNVPEAVVAMLATASLGAIWSSCSPDFGAAGVLDRFGQIEPRFLFAADGYVYNGKRHALGDRLQAVLDSIPSIEHTIMVPFAGPEVSGLRGQVAWDELLADDPPGGFEVDKFPFAQPLYILYTSGTTGKPKCIVHGAGGTLLKHLEEHRLQTDVQAGTVLCYFTSCGWMMWNWLVSGLASGATIVLYDGSPLHPGPQRLFDMIDRDRISIFGTSPRFLSVVEKSDYVPRENASLKSLRTILSTGAPLHAPQFEWVYENVKDDLQLASISGGTDLVGCFVLGSPFHPVRSGEIQCRALGMKVESVDDRGEPVVGRKGELVCSAPFPSMPVGFWNDPDGERYRSAYFDRFPGRWHHGDFIEFTENGSAIIYGRSDATLNPAGVRIGTAEIYRVVEQLDEVTDSLAVGIDEDGDVKILLYVVLAAGFSLDEALVDRIRKAIRARTSPRHVPAEVHAIREVPRTISGKPVELAVTQILRGEEPGNRDALANPEALDQFEPRR